MSGTEHDSDKKCIPVGHSLAAAVAILRLGGGPTGGASGQTLYLGRHPQADTTLGRHFPATWQTPLLDRRPLADTPSIPPSPIPASPIPQPCIPQPCIPHPHLYHTPYTTPPLYQTTLTLYNC